MAKELPYFQFEPAEYLTGDIQLCSLEAQGLFINIQALYWQKCCELKLTQVKRRFKEDELIEELIEEGILKVEDDYIIISFLQNQYTDLINRKARLSEAGKKGAKAKKQATLKPPLSNEKAPLKQPKENRIEEIKEKKVVVESAQQLQRLLNDYLTEDRIRELKELTLFTGDLEELKKKFCVEFIGRYGLNKSFKEASETFKSWMHKDRSIKFNSNNGRNPDAKLVYRKREGM